MCVIRHRILGENILEHLIKVKMITRESPFGRLRPAYWLLIPSRHKRENPSTLMDEEDNEMEYSQNKKVFIYWVKKHIIHYLSYSCSNLYLTSSFL